MTKPSTTIDYVMWAAPTVLFLLLVPPAGGMGPERGVPVEKRTGVVEYFNPEACQYALPAEKVKTSDEIFCQFAQRIIENSEEISPDVYKILLENRKNLLL